MKNTIFALVLLIGSFGFGQDSTLVKIGINKGEIVIPQGADVPEPRTEAAFDAAPSNDFELLLGTHPTPLSGADGADGTNGTNGTNGADGADAQGVPVGGTTGQHLIKSSNVDHATEWATVSGGSAALDDLTNVTATSPVDGDIMSYDNASSTWIIGQPSGGSSYDPNVDTTIDDKLYQWNRSAAVFMKIDPIGNRVTVSTNYVVGNGGMPSNARMGIFWASNTDYTEFGIRKNSASNLGDYISGGITSAYDDIFKITSTGDFVTVGSYEGGVDGVIIQSPDLTRWRITIDNSGVLTTTSL